MAADHSVCAETTDTRPRVQTLETISGPDDAKVACVTCTRPWRGDHASPGRRSTTPSSFASPTRRRRPGLLGWRASHPLPHGERMPHADVVQWQNFSFPS